MKIRMHLGLISLIAAVASAAEPLRFPTPPQQFAPWTPPDSIPTNLLSTVVTLFEQGFPDPRGCEFRQITVEVSDVWGRPYFVPGRTNQTQEREIRRVSTTGWVLPERDAASKRFAICWNGLVYPLVEVGSTASLHAEAANFSPGMGHGPHGLAINESRSVFSTNATSSRVLLLLRCGETTAALTNWLPSIPPSGSRFVSGTLPVSSLAGRSNVDPYLQFAGDWAWALFDRMICAHMRGDVSLAAATARQLGEAQPKIEAEAVKRGIKRQPDYNSRDRGTEKPYLDFLAQLPHMLTDLERRERENIRVPVLDRGLTNFPAQSSRIEALIHDLDLVSARQSGQPGGVSLTFDPIIAALVNEGDAAVDALLDCYEKDKRLTRSVSFGRDFFRSRNVIPVATVAGVALRSILQGTFQGVPDMRAYWRKYRAMPIEERWYAILNDDAETLRWLEAAGNITRPANQTMDYGGGFLTTSTLAPSASLKLRGESLRGKSSPSVTDLLTRRALDIVPTNAAAYNLPTACELCLRLADWDIHTAGPVATTLVERCRMVMEYSDSRPRYSGSGQQIGLLIARLTTVRARAGEAHAFDDYASWLKTTTPDQLQYSISEALAPLLSHSTNAAVREAAESMFGSTNSPWGTLPWKNTGSFNPLETDLIRIPAFRRLLARELDIKTVRGSFQWMEPGTIQHHITNLTGGNMVGSRTFRLPERERPPKNTRIELRWCDWIAFTLAEKNQIPPFNPFLEVERRDELLRKARALMENP